LEEIKSLLEQQISITASIQSKFISSKSQMTVPQTKDAAQALEASANAIKILLEILG
jgi:hypothetical protein